MISKRLKSWAALAFAAATLLAAESAAQAAGRGFWSFRSYRRTTAAAAPARAPAPGAAQANRSTQRRYSYAPTGATYSPPSYSPGRRSGYSRGYQEGYGYSPRDGIHRADFKIRGL